MKKLLLISLIIGTTLAQIWGERSRIAQLRRRQQLSEQDLTNGGFLPTGSSRLTDSFRGLENSFDTFPRRRNRFRSNVEITNAESRIPRRRDYLQSLRSKLRRNGRIPITVGERRTYMPAIKKPRFTPNLTEVLPRRTPSYSPTARGVDSNWTPRIPSTVSGLHNFLPSNLKNFIERTNPVNDRSYVSPRKSIIAEPIPVHPSNDRHFMSPVPSLPHKPEHVAPKVPVLPIPQKLDYAVPKDPVLPLPHKSDYVPPKDLHVPVLPDKAPTDVNDPNYVADPLLIGPLEHLNPLTMPLNANDPSYVDPAVSSGPLGPLDIPMKPKFPKAPTDVNDPNYVANPLLTGPLEHLNPLTMPLNANDPSYVDPAVPSGPLGPSDIPMEPKLSKAPTDVNDPNYVADPQLTGPFGAIDPFNIPVNANDPSYVDPAVSSGPLDPLDIPMEPKFPKAPTDVNDPNYVPDPQLIGPFGAIDPFNIPVNANDPSYVDPAVSSGPLDTLDIPMEPKFPKAPTDVNDPNYVADPQLTGPFGAIDPFNIPVNANDPSYVDPAVSSGPLDPLDIPMEPKFPKAPTDVNDPNYVADPQLTGPFGAIDPFNIPVNANDPSYVDPAVSSGPLDPLDIPMEPEFPKAPTDVNDPNYVADPQLTGPFGPLDPLTMPLNANDPSYIDPNVASGPVGPLDIPAMPIPEFPSSPIDVRDPNYVEPSMTGPVDPLESLIFGPLEPVGQNIDINAPGYVDPLSIDQMNPFGPLSPLTPMDALDPSAVSPSNKPGYVPENEPFINSMGPIDGPLGGTFDPNFFDPSSFREPLVSIGGEMGDPLAHLTSSKPIDPNYVPSTDPQVPVFGKQADAFGPVVTSTDTGYVEPAISEKIAGKNVGPKQISPKGKEPKGPMSAAFGPKDFPQDQIGARGQFPDIPSFSGPRDQSNAEMGGSGGLNDPLMNPSGYAPEPVLPESTLFDFRLPPMPDMPASASDPTLPEQLLTRTEINEAARREYAKSADAFDPKWDNPNVRNSKLYVEPVTMSTQDVRPANIKTLFDFLAGSSGANIVNSAVDKVSKKTASLIRRRWPGGYVSKFDAFRAYEG